MSRWHERFAIIAVAALMAAAFAIRPQGFVGGGSDDAHYARAAIAWLNHFPYLGTTHWDLRHPFTLALAAVFALFGIGQDQSIIVAITAACIVILMTWMMMRRFCGPVPALIACLLLASQPLFATIGTAAGPDVLELAFAVGAFWAFARALDAERPAPWLMGSGLATALAWCTRETSGALVVVLAAMFLLQRGPARRHWLALGSAAAVPVMAETLFYLAMTGDPLYRLRVDSNHIHIPSTHMLGGVSHQAWPFFNVAVARQWLPTNDFLHVNWLVDPYLSLFLDPSYGPVFWLAVVELVLRARAPAPFRRLVAALAVAGAGWFLFALYGLTIRPEPRYFAFVAYTATMLAAMALARLAEHGRPVLAALLVAGLVAGDLLLIDLRDVRNQAAYDAVAFLRATTEPVSMTAATRARLDLDLRASDLAALVAPARPGAVILRLEDAPGPAAPCELWRSAPGPSLLSRLLAGAGLDRHLPPHLWRRLERRSPTVTVGRCGPPPNPRLAGSAEPTYSSKP